MDEMEFTEAESNMNDLVSEYQQYQVRLKILISRPVLFPDFYLVIFQSGFSSINSSPLAVSLLAFSNP